MESGRKRTKKTKKNRQEHAEAAERNINSLSLDLAYDILNRLPLKSIVSFLSVSKQWASIIRSRDFIRSFHIRSSLLNKPRLLIAFSIKHDRKENSPENWHFFSTTSAHLIEEQKRFVSTLSLRSCPDRRINGPSYVQGLLSFGYGQVQVISNPSTGKCVTLPRINSSQTKFDSFFGYDPINDQYKVMARSFASTEHQVYTLGESSWRGIGCKFPHYPETDGLCIDGIVYYGANTLGEKGSWLVRFELKSEDLDLLIRLPHNESYDYSLINYEGKVTSARRNYSDDKFDLWVLKDVEKSEWSKISIDIRPWKDLFGPDDGLKVRGILHTGEIMFSPGRHYSNVPYYVIYYDHKENRVTKRYIKTKVYSQLGIPFLDYVESLELL